MFDVINFRCIFYIYQNAAFKHEIAVHKCFDWVIKFKYLYRKCERNKNLFLNKI